MVLSRFWYVVIAVSVAAAMFLLYLATGVSNRNEERTASKLLNAGSVAVALYLKDDAQNRANALIPLAVNPEIAEALKKGQTAATMKEIEPAVRDKANTALRKFRELAEEGISFDALWAVDVHGRVVASENFEKGTGGEGFEMGGYPIVADAMHGWIRDDSWLLGDELWRVVARPVEIEAGGAPVGAIVGGKKVDDRLAHDIVDHTGASVVFYIGGKTLVKGTPVAADTHLVGLVPDDLAKLASDEDYQKDGRSKPRLVRSDASYDVRAVFARLPGDAWDLGAGFAVMHQQQKVTLPTEFYGLATDDEKKAVPTILLVLLALGAVAVGLVLSLLEHTMPLSGFKKGLKDLADKNSKTDVLKPSTFRGSYKELAVLTNDALDKVAAASGIDRGPADLSRVLGPLPAEPQMSAFSIPDRAAEKPAAPKADPMRATPAPQTPRSLPNAPPAQPKLPAPDPQKSSGLNPKPPGVKPPPPKAEELEDEATSLMKRDAGESGSIDLATLDAALSSISEPPTTAVPATPAKGPPRPAAAAPPKAEGGDEETEWRQVYADFVAMKKQLGEAVDKLTYEKFRGTLQRNKDALMSRHGCTRVSFRVYEKQGRAALKASPVK